MLQVPVDTMSRFAHRKAIHLGSFQAKARQAMEAWGYLSWVLLKVCLVYFAQPLVKGEYIITEFM